MQASLPKLGSPCSDTMLYLAAAAAAMKIHHSKKDWNQSSALASLYPEDMKESESLRLKS